MKFYTDGDLYEAFQAVADRQGMSITTAFTRLMQFMLDTDQAIIAAALRQIPKDAARLIAEKFLSEAPVEEKRSRTGPPGQAQASRGVPSPRTRPASRQQDLRSHKRAE